MLEPGNAIEITDFMGTAGYYIDNGMENWETLISTVGFDIPRGTYQIIINYKTEGSGQFYNVTCRDPDYKIITGRTKVGLDSGKSEESFNIWLNESVEDFRIELGYGGNGYLLVNGICIKETNAWKRIQTFILVTFLLLIDSIYILYHRNILGKITVSKRKIFVGLLIIILFSSYPIFSYYLYDGHDLQFHLMRIQGLKDGLLDGQFPVKIQPGWMNGYGYGVSVFYGDIFLYIPAFFTLLGFPIQTAYKIYMIIVSSVTCLTAYFCFGKMFKDDKVGLLASMLYTLAPYRLSCLYIRGAVGEYTALAFFPLIFYGLYIIVSEREEKCHEGVMPAIIGFSGLILTHILSCEMVGVVTIVFCLILWRRIIRPKRFLALCKVVLNTVIINLWFIVPFLDYMQGSYKVTERSNEKTQTFGLFVGQLFSFFPQGFGDGYSVKERLDPVEIMPLSVGGALIFGAILFVFYWIDNNKDVWEKKVGKLCLVTSFVLLWMTTIWFPWDKLQDINSVLKFFIQKLQFPWRLLGVITILLTVVCCCLIKLLQKNEKQKAALCACFLGMMAILTSGWMLSSMMNKNDVVFVPDKSKLDTFYSIGGEYIPSGTSIGEFKNEVPLLSDNIIMTSYNKVYNNIWISCENNSVENGMISLPLLYYKGYIAMDENTKELLEVIAGSNNRVGVNIPSNYHGSIRVKFMEPWYWRVAEIISLLFFVGIVMVYFYSKKKNKLERR